MTAAAVVTVVGVLEVLVIHGPCEAHSISYPQPVSSAQLCSISDSQPIFASVTSYWAQPKAVSDYRQLDGQPKKEPAMVARRGQGLRSSEPVALTH